MQKKIISAGLIVLFAISHTMGQINKGNISGDFMLNANFYQRDTAIGASNNPLYDNALTGGESWLGLQYTNYGFTANVRFDFFHNSNIHNPVKPYSAQGIGMYAISKDIKDLQITGGYIYDQIGSGILFRSYEDRGLGIDNALIGLRLKYKLFKDRLFLKGFVGRQKNLFLSFEPVIKGINAESFFDVKGKLQLTPGASIVNRTLDPANMALITSTINSYNTLNPTTFIYTDRFTPTYNTYAYSFYNTANIGNFTLYTEYAGKTHEAINNAANKLIDRKGSIMFGSINYSVKGFGITLQGKKTEDFIFRTSPNEQLLKGMISFQPPMAKQNSLRLISRYNAATQELGENAFQADVFWSPKQGYKVSGNFSHIDDGNKTLLYQEIYADLEIKKSKKWVFDIGAQNLFYNQDRYQVKPLVPNVKAITPFLEVTYKRTEKTSIRTEIQYMDTKQDYGSWVFVLLELSIAPHWSFAASDMYNIKPSVGHQANHYYNFFASYSQETTRFTLAYVKQVDGINCTGGVCRYEPAFSGVKFTAATSF
jgi:hypothetical protein